MEAKGIDRLIQQTRKELKLNQSDLALTSGCAGAVTFLPTGNSLLQNETPVKTTALH